VEPSASRCRAGEWLAAGGRERPEVCRDYISALAEEERAAAAIERTVNLADKAQDLSACRSLLLQR
jgi:hypothetical protein